MMVCSSFFCFIKLFISVFAFCFCFVFEGTNQESECTSYDPSSSYLAHHRVQLLMLMMFFDFTSFLFVFCLSLLFYTQRRIKKLKAQAMIHLPPVQHRTQKVTLLFFFFFFSSFVLVVLFVFCNLAQREESEQVHKL